MRCLALPAETSASPAQISRRKGPSVHAHPAVLLNSLQNIKPQNQKIRHGTNCELARFNRKQEKLRLNIRNSETKPLRLWFLLFGMKLQLRWLRAIPRRSFGFGPLAWPDRARCHTRHTTLFRRWRSKDKMPLLC